MNRAAVLLATAFLPGILTGQEAEPPRPENPFSGFETHVLDNGLRLWHRNLPGAANTSVGMAVPYGWDQDPRGKEELAHFTEHMLFSDHRGRSEEEIKDQVESLGGRRNGSTSADHTFYYVTLPNQHGLFGVEWLSRILEPHAVDPAGVERNRQPVALEIRARPRELFDHLAAWLNPEWLQREPFWEREFGLETRAAREYDRHTSLHAITPEDLLGFYDRYYAPGAMTLVVVGDLARDSVLAVARRTFGTLEERPVPRGYEPPEDPDRAYHAVSWTFRPNVRYRRIFKVYDPDAATHARLVFLAEYLDRRLSARLRFGETKAVYSIRTAVAQRGPAAYLLVEAPIDEERWDYARGVIEEELAALADGSTPPETFRNHRDAVVEQLAAENREAQDLVFWVRRAFYQPDLYADFPDLPATFRDLDQDDIADFVQERFVPERQVTYIYRPQPLTQGALLILVGLVGVLTLKGTARLLTTPLDMTRIPYLARLRPSPPIFLAGVVLVLGGGAVGGRLLVAAVERAFYAWVIPVDSYALQMGPIWQRASWALRSSWPTSPFRPALYLEPRQGRGYLFRVRAPEELLSVLEELGAPVEGADGG